MAGLPSGPLGEDPANPCPVPASERGPDAPVPEAPRPPLAPGPGPANTEKETPKPGVLSPADQALLAAAIKEGMAKDPPSWLAIGKSVLFVVIVGALLTGGYQALQHWRPPAPLTLKAEQTVSSRQMTFGGPTPPVLWRISSASASGMLLTGPETTTVEIDLPLPPSDCNQVAADLGSPDHCDPKAPGGPAVSFGSPFVIEWTTPDPVFLLRPTGAEWLQSPQLSLTVASPTAVGQGPTAISPTSAASGSAPGSASGSVSGTTATSAATSAAAVTIVADQTTDRQRWCFGSPASANRLRLQRGANQSLRPFTGTEHDIRCGSGLRLIVGTAAAGNQPLAVALQGVASLRFETMGNLLDAQSMVGQLHLGPSGSPVLGSPTELIVHSQPATPLNATMLLQADRSTLTLRAPAATSVLTDNGNLVTSAWDRYRTFTLPILLALIGGLIPILLSTMQGIMAVHLTGQRRRESP